MELLHTLAAELTTLWILEIVLFFVPFACIIASNEYWRLKSHLSAEFHRKYAHILSGLTVIVSTYILEFDQLLVLSWCLVAMALLTYIINCQSVHAVSRKTIGTFLFPTSFVVLLVLFGQQHIELVRFGIWILTIPDAAAALIGSRYGSQLPRFEKSLLGSLVFLLTTMIVVSAFVVFWWQVLFVSAILTTIEFFSRWGLDNILLPVGGAVLLFVLL